MSQRRRPKLGQHFLRDIGFRNRILDALGLRPADLVVEIGAGRGAMTGLLASRAGHVVAIELDKSLAEGLREEFGAGKRVEIQHADVLSVDLAAICRRLGYAQCVVFGNLPYYITSPILSRLGTFRASIQSMTLLMQREVADRLVARPGGRAYGYLTVSTQLFANPRVLFHVPPGAFSPAPKVQSSLVQFEIAPRFKDLLPTGEEKFLDFVKGCFTQKRKSLLNNLSRRRSREYAEQTLASLRLPASIRAEQLTIEQLRELFLRLPGRPAADGD